MKGKWTIHWFCFGVLAMILLTGYQPVVAAPPTGEVKAVGSAWGYGIPIPYLESTQALDWMELLYDHLVAQGADGKISPELSLAHKWDMSPDGLKWTFYIRKGVKFHDGVELTAKDVKFSIELNMLPNSVATNAGYFRRNVKSIEVKDPYTLVISCKNPDIFLDELLSMAQPDGMVLPKDYYERVGKDEFAKHPIGSGPYKWHSQMIGSFIKLEATDRHWREGVPRYKYMTFLVIPEESTRLSMLSTGEADIASISREAVKEALSAGLNIITKEDAGVVYLMANKQWKNPVFSDIRFRKALNLAIDKESIIKHVFAGLADPIINYPGPSVSAIGGYQGLKPYPYDPKEAARLIKEGGWEGYEFTLISYPRPTCTEYPMIVEAAAGYWQKIGLKPKIRMTDYNSWRTVMNEGKDQDTVHGSDDHPTPSIPVLLSKFQDRWYGSKNNRARVNDPWVNEKFDRISKSLNRAEVAKLLGDIYRWAHDQYSLIAICVIPEKLATTKRIPKWDPGNRSADRNYLGLIKQ